MESENINKAELEKEIYPIQEYAAQCVIKTDSDNIRAADYLKQIKGKMKVIREKFKPLIESAYQAHKKIKALESELLTPLESAESKIKNAMVNFERQAEAERRRLQEAQEAEARRIEAEARKAQEQAARLAEKGRDEKAEIKQQAADAIQAKADEVRQTVIEKPMTKNAGISYMELWKFEVTSPDDVPLDYRMIDEKKIAAVVRATKGTLQIPGVRVYSEKVVSARGN